MARKAMIKPLKMMCMSNKEEITKMYFSITKFLKMIITCTNFAVFIWNGQLLQHLFVFVHQQNNVLVI